MRRRRRQDRESGTVSVVAVAAMVAVIAATTLAVDLGRVAYTSRDQQGATDRAALDAVRAISDLWNISTAGYTVTGAYDPQAHAEQLAAASLAANTGAEGRTSSLRVSQVDVGRYDAANNIFYAWDGTFTPLTLPTHVRVETRSTVDTLFVPSSNTAGSSEVVKEAIAIAGTTGAITVGSGVVNVDSTDSRLLNPILGGLLGGNLNLAVADYQGLVDANLDMGLLLAELGISAGTPDAVLDSTSVSAAGFLLASASALNNQGDADSLFAATVLGIMASQASGSVDMTLGDFLSVTSPTTDSVGTVTVNVFDLVFAALTAADGNHFVTINNLGVSLPGVSRIDVSAEVIEPAQVAVGPALWDFANNRWMTTAETAQADLDVTATLQPAALSLLGLTAYTTLPLHVNGGAAQASLTSAYCNSQYSGGTTLTNTQGATVWIGGATPGSQANVATIRTTLPLVGSIDVATVSLLVDTAVLAPGSFVGEHELPSNPTASGGGGTIDIGGMLAPGKFTGQLTMLTGLISLNPGQRATVINEVVALLRPVLENLENSVVQSATDMAGLTIGHADTTLEDVHCNGSRLLVK